MQDQEFYIEAGMKHNDEERRRKSLLGLATPMVSLSPEDTTAERSPPVPWCSTVGRPAWGRRGRAPGRAWAPPVGRGRRPARNLVSDRRGCRPTLLAMLLAATMHPNSAAHAVQPLPSLLAAPAPPLLAAQRAAMQPRASHPMPPLLWWQR